MAGSVNVEVECSACGRDLTATAKVDKWGNVIIEVEPCGSCLSDARAEAKEEAQS